MATNQNPGMDKAQAEEDRAGFHIEAEMTTGGKSLNFEDIPHGPEVGNPYDEDPLGEEYEGMTYKGGTKASKNEKGGTKASQKEENGGTKASQKEEEEEY